VFRQGYSRLRVYPFIKMVLSDEVVAVTSLRVEKLNMPAENKVLE
jgi:hypothetical protein